jgi:hypothetical protein
MELGRQSPEVVLDRHTTLREDLILPELPLGEIPAKRCFIWRRKVRFTRLDLPDVIFISLIKTSDRSPAILHRRAIGEWPQSGKSSASVNSVAACNVINFSTRSFWTRVITSLTCLDKVFSRSPNPAAIIIIQLPVRNQCKRSRNESRSLMDRGPRRGVVRVESIADRQVPGNRRGRIDTRPRTSRHRFNALGYHVLRVGRAVRVEQVLIDEDCLDSGLLLDSIMDGLSDVSIKCRRELSGDSQCRGVGLGGGSSLWGLKLEG